MTALLYDPDTIEEPEALAASLGIGELVAGVPPRLAGLITLPAAGYAVVRETWTGRDVLPGPVTRTQVDALPDPGDDPAIAEAAATNLAKGILETLRTTPIDPVALDANLILARAGLQIAAPPQADIDALIAYVGVPAPTLVQTAAATKALIRVLANYDDVVTAQRATINVLADTIRYLLQR